MNQEVEKLADELEKVLKSVKGCCGEYLVPEYSDRWQVAEAVIKAGYLPVVEARLEVLGEISKMLVMVEQELIFGGDWEGAKATIGRIQATIAHNQGKFYRRKE